MSGSELKQRLAAILAADVVGYSRLMSVDERATVAALDAARAVFRAQIESSQGRVIDMAGDSVLAVFDTATGAVSAALAIQKEVNAIGEAVREASRMRFRIGVHLGDVMQKADGSIYGDGVNIAARLEGLAEPGGITVSGSIRTAVKGKIGAGFEDQGEQKVKNIAEPVHAYRVKREGEVVSRPALIAGEIGLSLPDKPSIAVLPFNNMSGDPEQEYFADGMVEDIITELSRFQRLFVIARNTSFTYKGRSVDVKKVAQELGVHFVLEGSVRKAGNKVRVTTQLIDGETGRHVWAERYEEVLSDVFDLQERITRQVVGSMVPEIEAEEMRHLERGQRRFTEADDISWRALKALIDATFKGEAALALQAIALAEKAIACDANCRMGWYVLGVTHAVRVFFAWTQDRNTSLASARQASDKLMSLAPNDSRSYFLRGRIEIQSGKFAAGAADERRAHELNTSDSSIMFYLSWTEASAGNVERARELAALAIRMSPKDRLIGVAHLAYAMCAFIERDFPRLREWAELAIQSQPAVPIRRVLMVAYATEVCDASLLNMHLAKLQSVAPDFIPSLFRGDFLAYQKPEHMQMLLDCLRKAGLGNQP